MKTTDYLQLRGFARTVLGDRLGRPLEPFAETARAAELVTAGLPAAETAAAAMLYYLAFGRAFANCARPGELEAVARDLRTHARALAAHLPERQAAELLRVVSAALPQGAATEAAGTANAARAEPVPAAPANGALKTWTGERLDELRAYRRAHGTQRAAEHFGVSASRVRQLLPSGKPATKGYSAFTHRPK